jgi:hypothetical protein
MIAQGLWRVQVTIAGLAGGDKPDHSLIATFKVNDRA